MLSLATVFLLSRRGKQRKINRIGIMMMMQQQQHRQRGELMPIGAHCDQQQQQRQRQQSQ